jgi:C-terminal processing protease CtpA/Prc
LDLRRNHGGDNTLNDAVIRDLSTRAQFNRRGRLFVLVGRETFSAAQNLATRLERATGAIFVGEPTGGRPNHYGDLQKIPLPNSGLVATASTRYWQDSDPQDARSTITPSVTVVGTFGDYRLGRDPVLNDVLRRRQDPEVASP